jgi:hypothetical protein
MAQKDIAQKPRLTATEREGLLWEASRQYMRGQITVSKLQEIERDTASHNKTTSLFSALRKNFNHVESDRQKS